ncbi:chromate transporter [Formivibrio citricus]|uniref:Chromate transporter n=1 Tax=Formivibrio citricus TaxID=83765 RepID=A0A1I5AER1_9NEIS|nr:chromate efflux transporter [Formivibrio citricus]SFN60945.1 chromate transporter [Formivibrio citricus]
MKPASDDSSNPAVPECPAPGPGRIFLLFMHVGATAFGMGMLQSLRETLLKRRMATEHELAEGLALVQLYPGPVMANLAAYFGYLRGGIVGAVLALLGFIAPCTVLMLILAALYRNYGAAPAAGTILRGLDVVMAGVMLHLTLDFSRRQLKRRLEWGLAACVAALAILGANLSLLVLAGAGIGMYLRRKDENAAADRHRLNFARFRAALLMAAGLLAGAGFALFVPSDLGRLYLAFAHVGSVAFGNGVTILPLLRDAVLANGWLTPSQLGTAIAFSQITPGPILNAATFTGYVVADWSGGLMATFAIFAPSFVMTLVFAELFAHIRHKAWIKGGIHGAMVVFCGMVASVAWFMVANGVRQISDAGVAGIVWLALARFKWPMHWVLPLGVVLRLGLGWAMG